MSLHYILSKSNIFSAASCAKVQWMKQTLSNYPLLFHILTMCDNTSAINLSKNTFYTLERRTLRLDTTFHEIMHKREILY